MSTSSGEVLLKLFRGQKKALSLGRHRNPFWEEPRQPRDTILRIHSIADDWFFEMFGVRARTRALMCSTNPLQAYNYGPYVRIIEPVPPYRLISSSQVDDFIEIQRCISGLDNRDVIYAWLEEKMYYCVEHAALLSDDSRGEVMVFCEFYDVAPAPGYPPF